MEIVSKFTITILVKNKKAPTVYNAIVTYMKENFTQEQLAKFKSITFDQGKEFAFWRVIQDALDLKIYFADPGCPWQRPLNENTNRLIRNRGLPKGKVLSILDITDQFIGELTDHLNERSRKSLDRKLPREVFWVHLNNSF